MDGRSDLYSLAVTWYTLIAGQPPFIEDEPSEVLRHHLSRPFPDLQELTDVPMELLDVMAKASEKRPEDRYASAAEMEEAVEKLLADVPFGAVAHRAAKKLSPHDRRKNGDRVGNPAPTREPNPTAAPSWQRSADSTDSIRNWIAAKTPPKFSARHSSSMSKCKPPHRARCVDYAQGLQSLRANLSEKTLSKCNNSFPSFHPPCQQRFVFV